MFSVRTIVLIVAAGAALAACDPAPTTTSGPTTPPTTTDASPADTATDTPPPTASRTPTQGTADAPDACPVSAQTLLGVLKGTDIAKRGGDPTALEDVRCYKNYAFAHDADKSQTHQLAYFLMSDCAGTGVMAVAGGDGCHGCDHEPQRMSERSQVWGVQADRGPTGTRSKVL